METFDLEFWQRRCPRDPEESLSRAGYICSPCRLIRALRWREMVAARHSLDVRVPVDVFVFGIGEPPPREMTKVGGLPLWPGRRPWPAGRNGLPMRFVEQLYMKDSRDIVGTPPGDVLLLLVDDEPEVDDFDVDTFRVEWVRLNEAPWIDSTPQHRSTWRFVTAYGQRFRTWDYPGAEELFENVLGRGARGLAALEATKIGGVPSWEDHRACGDRFLCSFSSVQGEQLSREWPWLNQSAPLEDPYREENKLMWMDMGLVAVFVDEQWNARTDMVSY